MRGVLFLCVANSVRSQIAEGLARRLAPPGVEVWSAGSAPGVAVAPMAVAVLAEVGIDASLQRPKGIDDIPLDRVDLIVTLCAEEVCPTIPRPVRRLHWPLPDPTGRLAAFRAVRDDLERRVQGLFAAKA